MGRDPGGLGAGSAGGELERSFQSPRCCWGGKEQRRTLGGGLSLEAECGPPAECGEQTSVCQSCSLNILKDA